VTTSIHLDDETRDRLRSLKQGGETYDETLTRILNEREHRLADAEPSSVPADAPRTESGDPILQDNDE